MDYSGLFRISLIR